MSIAHDNNKDVRYGKKYMQGYEAIDVNVHRYG